MGELFYRSRYTLSEPFEKDTALLLNSFSGSVDVVEARVAKRVKDSPQLSLDESEDADRMLVERGYYVDSPDVEDVVARALAERAKDTARNSPDIKYMFGLTLRCNLACKYCWQVVEQKKARQKTGVMSAEQVAAAFRYIEQDMEARGKARAFISLFGGEPLIDTPQFHALVRTIGDETLARGHIIHFTTNGRSLAAYREEVERYRPSIQISVDGFSAVNGDAEELRRDQRAITGLWQEIRRLAKKRATSGLFIRFLVTPETIHEFVALADQFFADEHLSSHAHLAVAPIQNKSAKTDPEVPEKFRILSLLSDALANRDYAPQIQYIDWRSLNLFAGLRAGVDELPAPAFFHCEANIDLTCFDQEGRLYACYEAIGDPQMSVGRYWPEVELDHDHLASYRDRSAFTIEQCSNCAMSPVCGGGCEVRGYKRTGDYALPFCDDLHQETALVMRNWPKMSRMLVGD